MDTWSLKNVNGQIEEVLACTKFKKYLGICLQDDGSNDITVAEKINKDMIDKKRILPKLHHSLYGRFHFEVLIKRRDSIICSGLLSATQDLSNFTDKNIPDLEAADMGFVLAALKLEYTSPHVLIYLELGILPLRFLFMKRCILRFQQILQEDDSSTIRKILVTQIEETDKNCWYKDIQKYLALPKSPLPILK